jgi:tRNA1(Val) A37 N6-methylase TrmN6
MREGFTRDALLGGRVGLLQRNKGHRAGTDAVLLAAAAPVRAGDVVCDLGAATGAVGLMIASREPSCRLVLVERDPDLAALARENLTLNGFAERGEVLVADILADRRERIAAGLASGGCDLVVTNPPFVETGSGARRSPEPARADAHELPQGGFALWIAAAADLLKRRGRLVLIQRADRLAACLDAMRPFFGAVTIRPVHPRAGEVASRILVTAVRDARGPLVIEPPLVLHRDDGGFTDMARRLHEGEALEPRP